MIKEDIMSMLYSCCSNLNYRGALSLFRKYPNYIDLTYDDGILFKIAIAHESTALLHVLLDFYKETKLEGKEDKLAYLHLKHILQDAAEAHDLSLEIQKIIGPYVIEVEESDNENEQDLNGFDIAAGYSEQGDSSIHLSHSASELFVHQNASVLLRSSSESLVSCNFSDREMHDRHSREVLGQGKDKDFVNSETE